MKRVAVIATAELSRDQRWDASASDLAMEVVRQLPESPAYDSMFVAAPAANAIDGQANQAAIFADRFGGKSDVATFHLDAGDASGAAALHAAYAHIAAGLSRVALVLGVAKVSDSPESDRNKLLDSLIDREVESPLGLTYQSLAALLADLYIRRYDLKKLTFAHVVAKNAFNGHQGDHSFLKHAPTAQEVMRDLVTAAPLVRSDFAPFLDGATAVLLAELPVAAEVCDTPIEILSVASGTGTTVIADRKDPLNFVAVETACSRALQKAEIESAQSLDFVEIDNSCSIVEVLTVEGAGLAEPGQTTSKYSDGFGKLESELPINPSGGQQAKGAAFGTSALDQAHEIFLQFTEQAGRRQIARQATPGQRRAMSVSVFGLGNQAFATIYGTAGDDHE